ncbi:tRNA (N(6)-L-threonylcarbamoyladenosine(37)-C(2))-methylthiotransferase MtaB [bacterium]|nr:tRNA (N(6)-L-threonylcarbamoyladenosine(37)-C(2))-methylthiotransferase MtaB [bacterium]
MPKAAFKTLGCKLNRFETACLVNDFKDQGFKIVDFKDQADVYLINTCTVTLKSDHKSRQIIRQAVRRAKEALIVVTGCYVQTDAEEIAKIKGVDLVVGNTLKSGIASLALEAFGNGKRKSPQILVDGFNKKEEERQELSSFMDLTRAFIKIQDGCDSACTYCKVRFARGPSRSLEEEKILAQIRQLTLSGYKEIVLTGVNLGSFKGREGNLTDLLKKILRIDGLGRIRLTSIEPQDLTDELIELMATGTKICPHLHLPLQSGDDKILRRMGRSYDPAFYQERVERVIRLIPSAAIGADVMVGFPGEDGQSFEKTLSLLSSLPFSYFHIFRFSKRDGTLAAKMDGEVSCQEMTRRSKILRTLSAKKSFDFRKRFEGKELSCLILKEKEAESLTALSDNYIKINLYPGDEDISNKIVKVKIKSVSPEEVSGKFQQF